MTRRTWSGVARRSDTVHLAGVDGSDARGSAGAVVLAYPNAAERLRTHATALWDARRLTRHLHRRAARIRAERRLHRTSTSHPHRAHQRRGTLARIVQHKSQRRDDRPRARLPHRRGREPHRARQRDSGTGAHSPSAQAPQPAAALKPRRRYPHASARSGQARTARSGIWGSRGRTFKSCQRDQKVPVTQGFPGLLGLRDLIFPSKPITFTLQHA